MSLRTRNKKIKKGIRMMPPQYRLQSSKDRLTTRSPARKHALVQTVLWHIYSTAHCKTVHQANRGCRTIYYSRLLYYVERRMPYLATLRQRVGLQVLHLFTAVPLDVRQSRRKYTNSNVLLSKRSVASDRWKLVDCSHKTGALVELLCTVTARHTIIN